MRSAISRLIRSREGAAAAEYALVLALLGAALTFGAMALGTSITHEVEAASQ